MLFCRLLGTDIDLRFDDELFLACFFFELDFGLPVLCEGDFERLLLRDFPLLEDLSFDGVRRLSLSSKTLSMALMTDVFIFFRFFLAIESRSFSLFKYLNFGVESTSLTSE